MSVTVELPFTHSFAHVISFPWVGISAHLLMPFLSPWWGCLHRSLLISFLFHCWGVSMFLQTVSFPWVGMSASLLFSFFPLIGDICIFAHVISFL